MYLPTCVKKTTNFKRIIKTTLNANGPAGAPPPGASHPLAALLTRDILRTVGQGGPA